MNNLINYIRSKEYIYENKRKTIITDPEGYLLRFKNKIDLFIEYFNSLYDIIIIIHNDGYKSIYENKIFLKKV